MFNRLSVQIVVLCCLLISREKSCKINLNRSLVIFLQNGVGNAVFLAAEGKEEKVLQILFSFPPPPQNVIAGSSTNKRRTSI